METGCEGKVSACSVEKSDYGGPSFEQEVSGRNIGKGIYIGRSIETLGHKLGNKKTLGYRLEKESDSIVWRSYASYQTLGKASDRQVERKDDCRSLISYYNRERVDDKNIGDVFPRPQKPCDDEVGVMVGQSGDETACFEVSNFPGRMMPDTLLSQSHPPNHKMANPREVNLVLTTALSYLKVYLTSGCVQ